MERTTDGREHGHRVLFLLLVIGQIASLALATSSQTGQRANLVEANDTWKDTIRLGAIVTNNRHEEIIRQRLAEWEATSNFSSLISVQLSATYVNASEHIDIVKNVCNMLLPMGVTSIIAAIDGEEYRDSYIANRLISLVSRYLTVPILSANMGVLSSNVYRDDTMPFLQIGATLVQQCRAMMAFLEYHSWYHFSIVTSTATPDYKEFMTILVSLTAEISNDDSHNTTWEVCKSFPLDLQGNITSQFWEIDDHDCQILLVYASHEEAKQIFSYASEYNLLGYGYVWLVTEPVFGKDMNEVPDEFPTGLLGVKFYSRDYNDDVSIKDATSIYLNGLETYLSAHNHLPVINEENCSDDIHRDRKNNTSMYYFQKTVVKAGLKEKHIAFDKEGFLKNAKIVLMNLDSRRRWKEVGVALKDKVVVDGVTWIGDNKVKPADLTQHRMMRVTTIAEESFVRDYFYQCCVGLCVDILEQLSKDLEFNFELHVVDDFSFGSPKGNGSWNGMIGEVMDGKADAAIASMQATKARAEVVDLSVAFMETGISIMTKKSEGIVPSDAFLAPFDYGVWCFLTLFTVNLVAIVIFMFECLSPGGYDRNIWEPRPSRFTLGSSFWIVWALLFNNTVPLKPPKSYTAKFMTNMWGCFCLIFIAMYTANLVAHLIQEKRHDIISGFTDPKILRPLDFKPSLRYATVTDTMVEDYIERTNDEMATYMKQFAVSNASAAVKKLKNGELDAFIYGAAMLRHQAAKDKDCELRVVGDTVAHSGYIMAMTKGSHWKEPINRQILKYIDTGFLQGIADKWMTNVCNDKRENKRQPLGIVHSSGVFLLLLGGCIVSVFVFFAEHYFYKRLRERFKKKVKKRELVSLVAQVMMKWYM
uniref:Glutamate receptor ionotropic, NMDA 2B-like n=1 Tax=Saccoglossus kowalevskii TaxID=10224 RepID=A0ABM0M3T6_SACKO|nr:PREDICTED: glutamate receptor ionotropic, NMDA 2B-like [Saccoglossus kowalevskii]